MSFVPFIVLVFLITANTAVLVLVISQAENEIIAAIKKLAPTLPEKPDDRKPTFDEWFAMLIAIATADGAADYVENTYPSDWHDAYEDGDTPEDAWRTEKTYAAQDMG